MEVCNIVHIDGGYCSSFYTMVVREKKIRGGGVCKGNTNTWFWVMQIGVITVNIKYPGVNILQNSKICCISRKHIGSSFILSLTKIIMLIII
jgi:hypothetical protein